MSAIEEYEGAETSPVVVAAMAASSGMWLFRFEEQEEMNRRLTSKVDDCESGTNPGVITRLPPPFDVDAKEAMAS